MSYPELDPQNEAPDFTAEIAQHTSPSTNGSVTAGRSSSFLSARFGHGPEQVRPLFRRFFNWALLVPVGLTSVLFLYGAASLITAPYGLEYGEGIVLWQAAHISSPSEAYHDITQYPYLVFHYPPAFHVASRIAGLVTGDLLFGGRLVTFASALVIMLVLGALAFRCQANVADRTARWIGAVAAALLPAAVPTVRDWMPYMRVDMFGLMLSLLSMWVFIEGHKRPTLRYLAFIGFVAAMFSKQTLLSAPLTALIVAAIDSRKEALKFAGFAALVGSIPLVWMQYATGGQFLTHLFFHNQNTYTLGRALEMVSTNVWDAKLVLPLALAGMLLHVAETHPRVSQKLDSATAAADSARVTIRCLSIYLTLAFLVSWTSGKYGSASSYFLEFNLICCVFAGLAVAKSVDQSRRLHAVARVAVCLLVLLAGALSLRKVVKYAFPFSAGSRAFAASRGTETSHALDIVRRVPGPVFSWDLMLLMLAKKDVPLEPAIMFELSETGKWDISPFLAQIREGHYELIVANSYAEWLTSEEVSRAIASSYVPAEQFGSYRFYRPIQR